MYPEQRSGTGYPKILCSRFLPRINGNSKGLTGNSLGKKTMRKLFRYLKEKDFLGCRAVTPEPRNVAVYLSRLLRGDRLDELGRDFDLKRYSSVSTVMERTKVQISKDRKLRQRVEKLKTVLTKSQPFNSSVHQRPYPENAVLSPKTHSHPVILKMLPQPFSRYNMGKSVSQVFERGDVKLIIGSSRCI